jgi:ABC-type branched-subunit amino acid transport system ATPase component
VGQARLTTVERATLETPTVAARQSAGRPVLQVEGLRRTFDAVTAVDGIAFDVRQGETLSIIGPNGSGKTTTINLLSGLSPREAGTIVLAGKRIERLSAEQRAELGIARTFQNGRVFANMPVADNVYVGLYAKLTATRPFHRVRHVPVLRWAPLLAELGLALIQPPSVRREQAAVQTGIDGQLARFGNRLSDRREHLAYSLSYANRRRTEIARALAGHPLVLLLDEPTAGMNQTETAEVLAQLLELKAEGHTIVLVEHKIDLVMALSDRVIVMDNGKIIAEGPPAAIRNDEQVIEAYLGRRRRRETTARIETGRLPILETPPPTAIGSQRSRETETDSDATRRRSHETAPPTGASNSQSHDTAPSTTASNRRSHEAATYGEASGQATRSVAASDSNTSIVATDSNTSVGATGCISSSLATGSFTSAARGGGVSSVGTNSTLPPAPRPVLEVRDVDVFYGAAQALTGVSLEVAPGEIVSLLGGNASGKSTTMKTVLGLLKPKAGHVLLDGHIVDTLSTAERIRRGIASVPEARRVFPNMTVEENLHTGAFTRSNRREIKADLERMYAAFPRLAERRTQLAGSFSGGEQQMLAFARALMSQPRLICMDEPTMGLSPLFVDRVLDMIVDINTRLGVAVLMVEQNAELALSIANRGYVLQTGSIVLEGSAQQLLGDDLIREAYLGKAQTDLHGS